MTIAGSGFTGVTAVKCGATVLDYAVRSSSEIAVNLPYDVATGRIEVTAPGGIATSDNAFAITPGIDLAPRIGTQAAAVIASGAGFAAFEAVDIYFGIARQALVAASDIGSFSVSVQIPASAAAGTASVTAVGRHSGSGAQAQLTIANTVTVINPGGQSSQYGLNATLQIQASSTGTGQTLTFTAAGLPPALSINPSTGAIFGTVVPPLETYEVTVTAQDTTGASGSARFTWLTKDVA